MFANTNNNQQEISSSKRTLNYSNDNFLSMIKDLAGEIENQHPASEEQSVEKEVRKVVERKSTNLSVSTDASSESENISNQCWIRTKSGNYKDYQIETKEGTVEFNRAQSSKTKNLSYSVDSFLCIVAQRVEGDSAHPHCLLLVSSKSNQREIFFDTKEAIEHWHS